MTVSFLLAAALLPAAPQPPPAAQALDTVQVRALGLRRADPFQLPATSSAVDLQALSAHSPVDLAGAFDGIAGVAARDRQNRAQDLQLSIRGYGARSTFGVRGIRVLADGLPASAPDGQGQLSQFNLLATERIEVVRGPFSALHGNASGGVVQLSSSPGQAGDPWWLQVQAGSGGEASIAARLKGRAGALGYHLVPMHWRADGARQHSAARRSALNTRLDWQAGQHTAVTLLAQHFDAPDAQDPRGLTNAEWRAEPRLAAPVARTFNTRKSVRQDQLGTVIEHERERMSVRLSAQAGQRAVEQYLAIPAAAQANPLHGGGVIVLDSDYAGIDLRVSGNPHPALEWSVGLNSEGQRQWRRGYENFIGPTPGVRGALRREQRDTVWNLDGYTQLAWMPVPRVQLQAGLRHSRVQFTSDDRYLAVGNPDDSGAVAYHRSTPVAGLSVGLSDTLRWHLAVGRGLETPTFNELAYRADGAAGLALDLRAARSTQWESGLRWRDGQGASASLTAFLADTEDELAIASNLAGRSAYRNVGSTRRQGLELALAYRLGQRHALGLAWTRLDAQMRGCGAQGCAGLVVGNRLPGTVRDQLQLQWSAEHARWHWQLSASAQSAMAADDNGRAWAPGHALLDAAVWRQWDTATGPLRLSLALDNLADRRHVAAVIVNDGNGRYYEPGAGRSLRLGLRWALQP